MANEEKNNKAALLKPVDSDQKFTMYVAGFVLVVFVSRLLSFIKILRWSQCGEPDLCGAETNDSE